MGPDPGNLPSPEKDKYSGSGPVPRRVFLPGVTLSIIGFGGLMLQGMSQDESDRLVAESWSQGVNFFDVAPQYDEGGAEERLGSALASYRKDLFLAGKTLARSAGGARCELEQSLRRLKTGHLDLYQFHAVNTVKDLESIFAPGGALRTFLSAREEGLVRYIGFSSHSVPIALAMLDRFPFDAILFPINYVCYVRGNFGPQVVAKARACGTARVALKALAYSSMPHSKVPQYPNCWYRPIDDPVHAMQALRFSLSEDVTAVLPPSDARLYKMALGLAHAVTPLSAEERRDLIDSARGVKPIMKAKKQRPNPAEP
jgi:predicted aldo/keto reductase-like oxidoreductase